MRIINIINNELIIRQQKLENELERVLNSKTISTEDQIKKSIDLVNKLSEASASLVTWESYISKTQTKEQNGNINANRKFSDSYKSRH